MHTGVSHPTPGVHTSAGRHIESSGVAAHEPAGSTHASAVQAMPSSHVTGVPTRQPMSRSHVSTPLQASPSSHSALLRHAAQPTTGRHV